MLRPLQLVLVAAAVVFSCVGCHVTVSEPLSDIDKAEPDKDLVGTWSYGQPGKQVTVDVPGVKGHPKGMMRYTEEKESYYFFVCVVGKERYANLCLTKEGDYPFAKFGAEGEYESWTRDKRRAYAVFRYSIDKDTAVGNAGKEGATKDVMRAEKIKGDGVYETPPDWLAKYLDKHGREKLFPASEDLKFTRVKK